MALVALAVFWIAVALFLLFAPDHVFKNPYRRTRQYGAAGCFIFALFCLIALSV